MAETFQVTREIEESLKEAAKAQRAQGWTVGVAVLLADGRIWSRGYKYQGCAFRWANSFINPAFGLCGLIIGDCPYWRFERDDGWIAF